jgi:hypothetical protein
MLDIVAAILRALKVRKSEIRRVRFDTYGTAIRAFLRNECDSGDVRFVVTEPLPSVAGAHVARCSPDNFPAFFTARNVFTSHRDDLVRFYAERSEKLKREDRLIEGFRRLPQPQQTALLRALRRGPAVVLENRPRRARGGR